MNAELQNNKNKLVLKHRFHDVSEIEMFFFSKLENFSLKRHFSVRLKKKTNMDGHLEL